MSKIRLMDELYMDADSVQYTLIACGTREKIDLKTKKGTGEMTDYETIIGYYGTIDACIKGARNYILRKKIASDEIDSMDKLIAEINRLTAIEAELNEKLV